MNYFIPSEVKFVSITVKMYDKNSNSAKAHNLQLENNNLYFRKPAEKVFLSHTCQVI